MDPITQFSKSRLHLLAALVSQQLQPEVVRDEDWPEITALALRHGLGPMLLWALNEDGFDTDEDPHWEPLVSAARVAAINYALLKNTLRQVDAALAEAGVPALWLKGFALAQTVYPLPRLRPMVDLDLLVPYEQRSAALDITNLLGFHTPEGHYYSEIINPPEDLWHHYQLMGGVSDAIYLELHYRLLRRGGKELLPEDQPDWFWSQTQELSKDGVLFRFLKPEAHLLYLCAHAILQHGEGELYLLRYFDLHLLATKTVQDWQVVVDWALAFRWSYAVERALTLTVRIFDTTVPESVFTQLRERRSCDEDISRAVRLQAKDFRREKRKMLRAQMSLGERIGIFYRRIFPPKSFIRHFYAIKPGQLVFPYYVYHWFKKAREAAGSVRSRLARSTSKPL